MCVGLEREKAAIGEFIAGVDAFGDIIEVVRSGALGIARGNPRLHLGN